MHTCFFPSLSFMIIFISREMRDASTWIQPFTFLINDLVDTSVLISLHSDFWGTCAFFLFFFSFFLCLWFKELTWKHKLIWLSCLQICSLTLQMQIKFFLVSSDAFIQLTCFFLWVSFNLTMVQICTGSIISLQPPSYHCTAAKSQHITKSVDYIAIHSYYPRGGNHEPFQTAGL